MLLVKKIERSMDNLALFDNNLNGQSSRLFTQQNALFVAPFALKSSFCICYCTPQNAQASTSNQKTNLVFFKSNLIKLLAKHKSTTQTSTKNESSIETRRQNLSGMLASEVNPKSKESVIVNKSYSKEVGGLPKQSYFFKYSRLNEYKQLGVQVASPEKIRHWSERLLPTGKIVGEVLNANTLHHKTLKPLKGGLFCERIFGPTKDFQCACGKTLTKRQRLENTTYSVGLGNLLTPNTKTVKHFFCRTCDVEYTWALARRYQLGYISLAFPVTHLWYTKGFSNPISLLLDLHKYDLDRILYCSQTTSLEKNYELTDINITLQASNAILELSTLAKDSKKSIYAIKQDARKLQKQKNQYKITKMTTLGSSLLTTLKQSDRFIKNHQLTSLMEKIKRKKIENNLLSRKKQIPSILTQRSPSKAVASDFPVLAQRGNSANNLLLESLLVSLITMCTTVSYLPFISWLSQYLAKSNQENFRSIDFVNNPLPTPFLVSELQKVEVSPHYISEVLNVNSITNDNLLSQKWDETNMVTHLTKNFVGLKQKFRKNIVVLKKESSYSERQFHKNILEIRNDLKTLPKQIITQLNKQLYRDLYFNVTSLLSDVLARLQAQQNEITQSNISASRKLDFYLQYLGLKVKAKSSAVCSSFEADQTEDRKNVMKGFRRGNNAIWDLNLLAIQFVLLYLKKRNNPSAFDTKIAYESYQRLHESTDHASLERKPLRTPPRGPVTEPTFFYYNLYQLADDHLWENITDWNLLKSYITVYPDVMDRPIPSYKHRIPLSGLGSFLSGSLSQEDSPSTQQSSRYAQLFTLMQSSSASTKKYKQNMSCRTMTPSFENARKQEGRVLPEQRVTEFSSVCTQNRKMVSSSKLRKKPQAVLVRSTGAGIINTLLTSIRYPELRAMNKQLILLLRESRKKLLRVSIGTSSPTTEGFARGYRTQSSYDVDRFSRTTMQHSLCSSFDLNTHQLTTSSQSSISPNFSSNLTLVFNEIIPGQNETVIDDTHLEQCDDMKSTNLTRENFVMETVDITTTKTAVSTQKIDRFSGIEKQIEKHYELLRRAKIIKKFSTTKVLPKTLILRMLPVLPPELRPIMKMADQIATSDINRLYQRVLYRNERLAKLSIQLTQSMNSNFSLPTSGLDGSRTSTTQLAVESRETPVFGYEKHYAQRLLQEAVDNLIDNGRAGGNSEKDAKGRALKSLSEVLKGKQGRFRQYLLGKRVDYSGRSVIVVGPKLKIHQCGLPREMAIELYLPFIIQYLIQMNYTKTVIGAKTLISKNKELIESLLENIVRGHPVILNRAPTLHRLGFQAFQPILVDGRAILLHPMACTAFNADFDGDQMAVHIPITVEARSEAWRLMLARNNLLSPATGDPIILPSQDMVLGCYYLTTLRKTKSLNAELQKSNQYYSNIESVLYLYNLGKLHIHAPVWVKSTHIVFTESLKKPLEIRINLSGGFQEIYKNTEFYYDSDGLLQHQYIRTTPGRILFNLILKNR